MAMERRFDAVIIGAGHNGLVAAAYLAKAGLRVCVVERRPVLGGCCTTETLWGGYKVSTAAYVCGLLHPKIVRDLHLHRHGFEILRRDPSSFTPLPEAAFCCWGAMSGSTPSKLPSSLGAMRKRSRITRQRWTNWRPSLSRF